jgi:hypothetical protein
LFVITSWFHDLFKIASKVDWLHRFVALVAKRNAGVISFNWDLVLDSMLSGGKPSSGIYGMTKYANSVGAVVLKPHGSLNWYSKSALRGVKRENWIEVFTHKKSSDCVAAFAKPRQIISSRGKRYSPLIVAPSYLKDFSRPVFEHIWRQCTEMIGQARRVVLIGYSMPQDDLQARFILRSGFYAQVDGVLGMKGRLPPTGSSEVTVVNPDATCLSRIQGILNPGVSIDFISEKVEDWMEKQR